MKINLIAGILLCGSLMAYSPAVGVQHSVQVSAMDVARYGCSTASERAQSRKDRVQILSSEQKILNILDAHSQGISNVADTAAQSVAQAKQNFDLTDQRDAALMKKLKQVATTVLCGFVGLSLLTWVSFYFLFRFLFVRAGRALASHAVIPGPAGPCGPMGPPGPAGPMGPAGPAGRSSTAM